MRFPPATQLDRAVPVAELAQVGVAVELEVRDELADKVRLGDGGGGPGEQARERPFPPLPPLWSAAVGDEGKRRGGVREAADARVGVGHR